MKTFLWKLENNSIIDFFKISDKLKNRFLGIRGEQEP